MPARGMIILGRITIVHSVVLSLVQRCRHFGFHAWVLPQAPELPMANRREDVLVVRP